MYENIFLIPLPVHGVARSARLAPYLEHRLTPGGVPGSDADGGEGRVPKACGHVIDASMHRWKGGWRDGFLIPHHAASAPLPEHGASRTARLAPWPFITFRPARRYVEGPVSVAFRHHVESDGKGTYCDWKSTVFYLSGFRGCDFIQGELFFPPAPSL